MFKVEIVKFYTGCEVSFIVIRGKLFVDAEKSDHANPYSNVNNTRKYLAALLLFIGPLALIDSQRILYTRYLLRYNMH